MRILFLDVDGVLNSERWARVGMAADVAFTPPATADEAIKERRLDPECMTHLRKILKEDKVRIVMSTSWRHRMPSHEFAKLLAHYGCKAPVLDGTPWKVACRGAEVASWIENSAYKIKAYVCLDNEETYLPGQPLVRTDGEVGLTAKDVIQVRNGLLLPSAS